MNTGRMSQQNAFSLETLQDLVEGFPRGNRKPAVTKLDGNRRRTQTYEALFKDARHLAFGLISAGMQPGQTVGLFGGLDGGWIAACCGILYAGGMIMPLDLQLEQETLSRILRDSHPRFIFVDAGQQTRIQNAAPEGCRIYVMDKAEKAPNSWERLFIEEEASLPRLKRDDPAVLFYTSGTTGPPKGVPLTHSNIVFQLQKIAETGFLKPHDRLLLPLPPHHAYPLVIGILAPLSLGAAVVLPHAMTGPHLVRGLKEGGSTILLGVPRLYEALFEHISARFESHRITQSLFHTLLETDPRLRRKWGIAVLKWLFMPLRRRFAPRLRILAAGGSALSSELANKLESLGWQVAIGYGLTETAPLLTLKLPGDPRHDTVGRPVKGVQIRIDSGEIPKETKDGKQADGGEVLAKGPNVFSGYYNLPDNTDAAFTHDGWFRTGDLGYLDGDGYLRLTGRASTLIVTKGGENIQPDAIEAHLSEHDLIREAGVLQTEDGVLTAVVVPERKGMESTENRDVISEIEKTVRERSQTLPSYQHVHDVAVTHTPLPRTRLGKIRRHLLKDVLKEAKEKEGSVESGERGPVDPDHMSSQDRTLLENSKVRTVWDWLADRYSRFRLSPDSNPELDFGIDSMEWLTLALEIHRRTGVELDEGEMSEVTTIRDLLQIVSRKANQGDLDSFESLLEAPEEKLSPAQMRWLAPTTAPQDRLAKGLFTMSRWFLHRLFHLRSRGIEHVPTKGPFVIAPNHVSYLDPFAVAAAFSFQQLQRIHWAGFTGAAFRNILFRYFSRLSRTVPIDESQGAMSGLMFGATVLKRDKGLVWFPEGERSPDGSLQDFKSGVGLLLAHYPVPVIPVYIKGTEKILPPGQSIPGKGKILVVFGPPVDSDTLAQKGKGEEKMDRIASALHHEVSKLGNNLS
ncbi:MAG: AMP-binding protein [Deltaproteobacteria bacterium]|nr:AMP-binding protein [Deltaproteobacteria bacterium]